MKKTTISIGLVSKFGFCAFAVLFAVGATGTTYTNDYLNLAASASGLGEISVSGTVVANTVTNRLVDGVITSSGTQGASNGVMWQDTTKQNNFSASATFTFNSDGEVVSGYAIRNWANGNNGPKRSPKAWVLEGSIDETNWNTLDTKTVSDVPDWTSGIYRFYAFENTTPYKYYRITFTKSQSDNEYLIVSEWELYWIPDGGWTGGGNSDSITDAGNWGGTPGGTVPFDVSSKQYSITNAATVAVDADVTIAGGLDLSAAAGATLDFSSGNTLTAAISAPMSGAVTIISPVNFGTLMTGTGLSEWDSDSFVLSPTAQGVLEVLGGTLSYVAAATHIEWTGGGTGSITDAGNWGGPAGETMAFDAGRIYHVTQAATILVDSDVTLGALEISGAGAVTFTNPDAATTNTLTLVKIVNSSSETATFNCAVAFTGAYDVTLESESHFPGGVTATCPADGITAQGAAAHALTGHFTFTDDWTVAAQPQATPFVLTAGSTLTGQNLTGSGTTGKYVPNLRIAAGAYAHFTSATLGADIVRVSVLGTLEIDNYLYCYRGSSSYPCTIGLIEDCEHGGILKVGGLRNDNDGDTYKNNWHICVQDTYIGAAGIYNKYVNYSLYLDKGTRIHATANMTIDGSDGDNALENGTGGLCFDYDRAEIDTDEWTVTWKAAVKGSKGWTKKGTGTLILQPYANKMTGPVTIDEGTVFVTSNVFRNTKISTAGFGTGAVTVNDGATLAVDSSIVLPNAVTFNAGSKLTLKDVQLRETATSAITGTLTVSGAVTVVLEGTLPADSSMVEIPIANSCDAATLANLTVDTTNLVNANGARLTIKDGKLFLRRPMDGMFISVR